ncbi:hypothetical protein [Absidia glauca]|uniref:Uncharacterized protein n=1 Tax=Absidia glauca TaxID=4829 RepID=A0A168TDE3_ABSGL|nr:hypothetical protein [Absidia glauca]
METDKDGQAVSAGAVISIVVVPIAVVIVVADLVSKERGTMQKAKTNRGLKYRVHMVKMPNWGRICASLGHSGVHVDPSKVTPLPLMIKGEPEVVDEARAAGILKMEDLWDRG